MTIRAKLLLLLFAALIGGVAARADTTVRVPVPVVTIYPGDQFTAGMLTEREFLQLAHASSVIRDPAALIGKTARRTLLAGQPILMDAIREPSAIKQGVSVLMKFEADGLSITGRGVPLRSAVVGEMVELRNPDTGAIVRGLVTEDGSVSVSLP